MMSPRLADVGFLPIVIVWIILAFVGRSKAAKRKADARAPRGDAPEHGGMMDELRRAMEELKRAEMTQIAREQHVGSGEQRAKAYLQKRLRVDLPKAKPLPTPRDDEGSQETTEETTDYDLEAERLAADRRAQTEMQWHLGQAAPGRAEPSAPSAPPRVRASASHPLARYADGTARSALVLSMILGRPRSE